MKKQGALFTHFWGVWIILGPLFFTSTYFVTLAHAKVMVWILAAAVSFSLFGVRRNWASVSVVALAAISMHHLASVSALIQAVCIICGALLFSQFYQIKTKVIGKYLAAACLIHSAWVLCEYYGAEPYSWFGTVASKSAAISGAIGNQGTSGIFIAALTPFVFRAHKALVIAPLMATWAIHDHGSTTPLVGVVLSLCLPCVNLLYKLTRSYGVLFIATLATLAVAGLVAPLPKISSDISSRVIQWKEAVNHVKDPFFGNGVGWVPDIFWQLVKLPENFTRLHNEFLELFVAMGLTGCVIVGIILVKALWKPFGRASCDMAHVYSLCVVLFSSLFWFPMHIPAIATVALINCAILYRRNDEDFSITSFHDFSGI